MLPAKRAGACTAEVRGSNPLKSAQTGEWNGKLERVMVLEKGFTWNGKPYGSLSGIAKAMTGTSWNDHRFFGLRMACSDPFARAGHRVRINDTGAPPNAAFIKPIPESEVRHRCATSEDACVLASEIAVVRVERRRHDAAASP